MVWVCVCEDFVVYGCFGNVCLYLLCFVLFVLCFLCCYVYVYLIFFFSVLVLGLLPPSDNSTAVSM